MIPTRDRGEAVLRPVAALLACGYPGLEIRVVDQSRDDVTHDALYAHARAGRLDYVRLESVGIANALNAGIEAVRTPLVAITGDDCEPHDDWLFELAGAFAKDERIGLVFGNILPGPHDPREGFVPGYIREEPFLARNVLDKHHIAGTSACMALRRDVWQELGGFDPLFGAGAPLLAAEDTDLCIRALLAGYYVYEIPSAAVCHHGLYRWQDHRKPIEGYWYGTGAALSKQLKRGEWDVVRLLGSLARSWAFGQSRVAVTLGQDAQRRRRLTAFLRGMTAAALRRVDADTGKFVSAPSQSADHARNDGP